MKLSLWVSEYSVRCLSPSERAPDQRKDNQGTNPPVVCSVHFTAKLPRNNSNTSNQYERLEEQKKDRDADGSDINECHETFQCCVLSAKAVAGILDDIMAGHLPSSNQKRF
jgi:hypothetical protein